MRKMTHYYNTKAQHTYNNVYC